MDRTGLRLARLLVALGLLLFSCASASAQPAWEEYNAAIDSLELEQAAQLAQHLPEGGPRELALAEVALIRRRPDLSFRYTDRLQGKPLAPELAAKRALVTARQTIASEFSTSEEKQKAVSRCLREGLRSQPGSREEAQLLLLELERYSDDEVALAEENVQKIAELEGVDPIFTLQAQARLSVLKGRKKEAATYLRTLGEMSALQGRKRASRVYSQRGLWDQYKAEPRPQTLEAMLATLNAAVEDKGDAFGTLRCWELYHDVSGLDWKEELRLGQSIVEKMPDSVEKLAIMDSLLALCYSHDKPVGFALANRAAAIAHGLDEPVIEADFLFRSGDYQDSRQTYELTLAKALSLVQSEDLRGVSPGTFFRSIVDASSRQAHPAVGKEMTVQQLARDVEALSSNTSAQERLSAYEPYLFQAVTKPDPALLEAAFWPALQLALEVPEDDRADALRSLAVLRPFAWTAMSGRPDSRGELSEATVRALGTRLAQKPEQVERILDTYLRALKRDNYGSGYVRLAQWLLLLGRDDEARDMLSLGSGPDRDLYSRAMASQELGGRLLAQREVGGLDLIQAGLSQQSYRESAWLAASRMGWLALSLGRAGEAERAARESLAAQPGDQNDLRLFLQAGPHQLLALSLAELGQTEEALRVLEKGAALDQEQAGENAHSLALTRADVLLRAGRASEAANALPQTASVSAYEIRLRRSVAAGGGKVEGGEALLLPDDPVYASFQAQALGDPPVRYQAPPAPTTQGLFSDLVEGLERLRRREPENAGLKRLSAAELKNLMADAKPDEIYVQPVLLEQSVVAIIVTSEGASLVETFCDRARLERAVLELTDNMSDPSSDLTSHQADHAYLTRCLVTPWRSRFPSRSRLRWLGEGALRKLPLSALPAQRGLLLDSLQITYLDGPGMGRVRVDPATPALLIGGASDLPGTSSELSAVRRLFPQGQTWRLGDDVGKLRGSVPSHHLLHISTHGAHPDAVSLGGQLQGDGHDLNAFELAELPFSSHSLAVIGACDSALDAETGHDNSSLVSALRTAGAEVVVGSLWSLDDQVAARLFEEFYRALSRGASPEDALASAQRAIAKQWPHPYYWAGLQVVSGP